MLRKSVSPWKGLAGNSGDEIAALCSGCCGDAVLALVAVGVLFTVSAMLPHLHWCWRHLPVSPEAHEVWSYTSSWDAVTVWSVADKSP